MTGAVKVSHNECQNNHRNSGTETGSTVCPCIMCSGNVDGINVIQTGKEQEYDQVMLVKAAAWA